VGNWKLEVGMRNWEGGMKRVEIGSENETILDFKFRISDCGIWNAEFGIWKEVGRRILQFGL
jgi:hypothetical protein